MYFITTKRMLEVCFSAHPNIQYRTKIYKVFYDKIKIIGGLFIMAREKKSVHKV